MSAQTELLETEAWKSLAALKEASPERCKEVLLTACALQDIRDTDHAEFQRLADWAKRVDEATIGRVRSDDSGEGTA